MLAELLAARWLGHGRAIECALALIAGLYGTMLFICPECAVRSAAIGDISDYGRLIAIPFLIKAALTGSGVILNIFGYRYSRYLRLTGSLLGSMLWLWLILKFSIEHAVVTIGFAFCVVAAIFSIRIMGLAMADRPRPGAPGML